jgi:hypothetical protein
MRRFAVGFVAAAVTLLAAGRARATSIDPLTWQELAASADFIGVVECTVAGGIVAHRHAVCRCLDSTLGGA